jgi:Rrf2 family protein
VTSLCQTTGYAIEAMACLARQGDASMLVREIADQTGLPLPYLAKVIHKLGEAGLVESKRGHKGGVKLAGDPAAISLLRISAAVEATRTAHGDVPAIPAGPGSRFWDSFQQDYREKLASMTLADVVATGEP